MLIALLLFAGTATVMAQQQTPPPPQQTQQMGPVREYIQKDILPVVKQEHAKFINALTSSEKEELAKIQDEFKNLKPGPGMRGTYHPQMMNNRAKVQELLEQAKKIADAHPKAATDYKEAIEAKKVAWAKAIQEIREKNSMGYGRGMNSNRTPFILDRLSDPAFGLLFNGENFPMNMRPGMRPGGPGMGRGNFGFRGMHNRQMAMGMRCNYNRMGRNMGYRQAWMDRGYCNYSGYRNFEGYGRFSGGWRPGMMRAMNPEVKKELKAFAEKNIFPVLNKERSAFDKVLKNSEKRDIENARTNINTIKAEMKKHWQEMKKSQGQKLSDSARMAMRLDLQKNMLVVREVALKHYSELRATMDNLKQYLPKWKEGMHDIISKNMSNKGFRHPMGRPGYGMMHHPKGRMMDFHRKHRKMNAAVRFLLYDPAHPEEHLFPMTK